MSKRAPRAARAIIPSPERTAVPVAIPAGKNRGTKNEVQVRLRQDKFLAAFAVTCQIEAAAEKAGLNRETVRIWRRDDPDFAKRFEEMKPEVEEVLADSTMADALGEWDEKKRRFLKGNPILKIFLLKALNPEKYREQFKLDHAGTVRHTTLDLSKMSKAELMQLAAMK